MADTIDFASLSLQDALDLAILVEEEAQERYLEFVDQMEQHHTPEAARFFAAMAKNEQKHGEELRARRRSLFGDAPAPDEALDALGRRGPRLRPVPGLHVGPAGHGGGARVGDEGPRVLRPGASPTSPTPR